VEPARPTATPKPAKQKARPALERAEKIEKVEDPQAHFRRAQIFLSHGWMSDAEEQFAAALRADSKHIAAREGYVALLLDQQRVSVAQRVLQDGLAINPGHPAFAIALARIFAGQRNYAAGLEVLDRAGPAAGNGEFQATRAAMLQRLGRHQEAVDAYQDALRSGTQPGTSWIGLGTSLEALERRSDAVLAYRRALTSGPLSAEAREYAENRARALE
jgi:MSHA biogenesis protein MshN